MSLLTQLVNIGHFLSTRYWAKTSHTSPPLILTVTLCRYDPTQSVHKEVEL